MKKKVFPLVSIFVNILIELEQLNNKVSKVRYPFSKSYKNFFTMPEIQYPSWIATENKDIIDTIIRSIPLNTTFPK